MAEPIRKPVVPAVEQACKILICLAENQKEMRLVEICKHLAMHRSRAYSILQELFQFGFVEKDLKTKTYSPGPTLFSLGRAFLDHLSYPNIVDPFLEDLAEETNSTAAFGLIIGDHILVVAKHEGKQSVGITLRVGNRVPIVLGAHGKAILAFMPEEKRKKILAGETFFKGKVVRIDKRYLEKEFSRCKELGFARDIGEVAPGVNVVSAPVFGLGEKLIGCVILFGTFPVKMIESFGRNVVKVAKQVSYKIGADMSQLRED
ncbi:IclR family transcriptional regulator [Thermodesulfobacteriota bacterium]